MLKYVLASLMIVGVFSAPAPQPDIKQFNFNGFPTFAPFQTFRPLPTFAPLLTFAPWSVTDLTSLINNLISSQQQISTFNGGSLFQSSVFNGTHLIFTNNTNTFTIPIPVFSFSKAFDSSYLSFIQQTLRDSIVQTQIDNLLASLNNPVLQTQFKAIINGFAVSPNPQEFVKQNYMNAFLLYNSLPTETQQKLMSTVFQFASTQLASSL
jgi:hypothetical protein